MTRRRRCCICHELFAAVPRVGKRQRACGGASCQRERHRVACQVLRSREAPAVEEERLRRRLGSTEGELRLGVVRDECGPKLKVVLEESLRLVVRAMRDEYPVKKLEQRRDLLRLVGRRPRDESDRATGPP